MYDQEITGLPMIKKTKKGFRVISHQTGKNLGTYSSKKKADKRHTIRGREEKRRIERTLKK